MINSLLIVAVNLADCVYFRYTQKRFTADEIFFADNSNSVQLVLKFAAETGTCSSSAQSSSGCSFGVTDARSHPDRPCARLVYHSVNTGLLVIAILLGIAACGAA